MNELLDEALEDLKRVDHLLFVTLKYTRTIDVIQNIVYRLRSACDFIIDILLQYGKKKRLVKVIPTTPISRINELRKMFSRKDKKIIQEFINFYQTLRKIEKAKNFLKHGEYRKNVSLIILGDDNKREMEVTVDLLNQYYKKIFEFIEFTKEFTSRK